MKLHLDLAASGGKCGQEHDNSFVFKKVLAQLRDAGGGTLVVGAGEWKTGPIEIFSDTEMVLDEGAILSFIPDPELYSPVRTRWEGVECFGMHPCIYSNGQKNIRISGKGVVDGSGEVWWKLLRSKRTAGQKEPVLAIEKALAEKNTGYKGQPGGGGGREMQFLRPSLVQFFKCSSVTIEGITVRNSPFWTVHPVYCDGVKLHGIHVQNPHDAPNTDGIDIDSCANVEIFDCVVTVGDDGIALKSGSGPDGIRANVPTCHVAVRNCTVGDGHGGIVIGSETAAGIFDITVEDCVFKGTDRGIRIKTRRGRGGDIHDLTFRNLVMENNLCPFAINMYYRCGADPSDMSLFTCDSLEITDATPRIHDLSITGVTATGCRASAGFIAGLPEEPIRNLVIKDCVFSTDETSTVSPDESDMFAGIPSVSMKSFRIRNAENPVFENVRVEGPSQTFLLE